MFMMTSPSSVNGEHHSVFCIDDPEGEKIASQSWIGSNRGSVQSSMMFFFSNPVCKS